MKTQREETHQEDKKALLRVAGGSQASKVAGAIVKYMQEGNEVAMIAIGAGAVNQAIKAFCISRGMASPMGWDLYCIPAFVDEVVDGSPKTAIKIQIYKATR